MCTHCAFNIVHHSFIESKKILSLSAAISTKVISQLNNPDSNNSSLAFQKVKNIFHQGWKIKLTCWTGLYGMKGHL